MLSNSDNIDGASQPAAVVVAAAAAAAHGGTDGMMPCGYAG